MAKFVCRSVFPFQLFPDTIRLEDEQLTVVRRGFMWRQIIPIKLPDLLNVIIHEAPLFCTVEIVYKYVTATHEKVPYIWNKDGRKFQKICMEIIKEQTAGHQGGQ